MKNDEAPPKPPVRKPAPKPKDSSTTTKAAPSKAGAGKKDGTEGAGDEDLGQGLSKEEAIAKVQDTFSEEYVNKLEEAKWQDKVEGFKGIGEQVVELQPAADVIEALAKFTKMKMKDWKESNINLIKEAIALFLIVA